MNHHQLSKMDLGYISLFVDNDEVVNGHGESKMVSDVIAKFGKDVREYCVYAKSAFPSGYQLYVPDFWHITFGRAKCLPIEDGQLLWDAACFIADVMIPMQAAGIVTRIHFAEFEKHGVSIQPEMQGSLYKWNK